MQTRREWRRALRLHRSYRDATRTDRIENVFQRRHVERVLEHLAVRLDENREARKAPHRVEQIERLETLQPQRHPPLGRSARQEQRARGIHAKARAEQRRAPDLVHHASFSLLRGEMHQRRQRRRAPEIRKPQHDSIVGRLHLHLHPRQRLTHALRERHPPGRIHAPAEHGMQNDPQRTHLVAELFDHHRTIVGHHPSGGALLRDVRSQRLRTRRIHAVARLEPRVHRIVIDVHHRELAPQLAHAMAQRHRPRRELAVPEGHPRRRTRRGSHDDTIVLDRADTPARGAKLEHIAHTRLVHELFVELTEPRAVREVHGVEPAIRNRAARDHRHHPRRARPRQSIVDAIPRYPRLELRRQLRRIFSRQHRQHLVEHRAREPVIRIRAAHEGERIACGPVVDAHHRHDALREHIERILNRARWLDVARAHRLHDRRALDEVVAEGRDHDAVAHRAEIVPRAPNALQPRAHPLRTLQLNHEIHRADVDPELERAR